MSGKGNEGPGRAETGSVGGAVEVGFGEGPVLGLGEGFELAAGLDGLCSLDLESADGLLVVAAEDSQRDLRWEAEEEEEGLSKEDLGWEPPAILGNRVELARVFR